MASRKRWTRVTRQRTGLRSQQRAGEEKTDLDAWDPVPSAESSGEEDKHRPDPASSTVSKEELLTLMRDFLTGQQ